mmetsp:Transcript_744/g.1780  ORF Transcript_744/g.1780 Transcript_744/m.1780 type:complete len:220 (+) Transcript_744:630-1289(+)
MSSPIHGNELPRLLFPFVFASAGIWADDGKDLDFDPDGKPLGSEDPPLAPRVLAPAALVPSSLIFANASFQGVMSTPVDSNISTTLASPRMGRANRMVCATSRPSGMATSTSLPLQNPDSLSASVFNMLVASQTPVYLIVRMMSSVTARGIWRRMSETLAFAESNSSCSSSKRLVTGSMSSSTTCRNVRFCDFLLAMVDATLLESGTDSVVKRVLSSRV